MLNLLDVILYPIQLVNVKLIALKLNQNEETGKISNADVTVETKSWSEVLSVDKGNAYLNVKISASKDKASIFNIDITYKGTCKDNNSSKTMESMKQYLEVQGIKSLWPYMREAVSNVTAKMDLPPLVLPTLDVLHTLDKRSTSEDVEHDINK